MRRWLRRTAVLLGVTGTVLVMSAAMASAHPLGNFTVNHYDELRVFPDRVEVLAVVDSAEIPTFQRKPQVDTDGDGTIAPGEARAWAQQQCAALGDAVRGAVDGQPLAFTGDPAGVSYPPGEGGLPTTRLSCELSAPAALDQPATLTFRDSFQPDRIGWREITAVGKGVALPESPVSVPSDSISGQLRSYPADLLSNPLDVRQVTLQVAPGGVSSVVPGFSLPMDGDVPLFGGLTSTVKDLAGRATTPMVGTLAVLLSLLLGASHAALPGHGKTVMAAYLAGRQGTKRDALLVGGTVTVTHSAGVLVLGLLISLGAAFAPEVVLSWLSVASGLLVALVGAFLLRTALRERRAANPARLHAPVPALVGVGHGHGHGHGGHEHGHGHEHVAPSGRLGRGSLIGMGVAGGLVPSPTALFVLVLAVSLGRTWFGVLLVLGYAVGMAATLTAAGLLLVGLRDRLARHSAGRWQDRVRRVSAVLPALTAVLVIVVGLGLAARGLA